MGHYTELHCLIKLRKDLPDEVVALLHRVVVLGDLGTPYPNVWTNDEVFKPFIDDPFFIAPRWYQLLHGSFIRHAVTGNYLLILDAEFKNYDGELQKFLDWIIRYVSNRKRIMYLGWWSHEGIDDRMPIHLFNGRISIWHMSKSNLSQQKV
jgi:hypothetical protein